MKCKMLDAHWSVNAIGSMECKMLDTQWSVKYAKGHSLSKVNS